MKTKLLLVFAFLAFQSSFADPIAPTLQPYQYCDPNNDGFGVFDLDSLTPIIVAAQSGSASDFVVTYHGTVDDAEDGINAEASPYYNIDPWSEIISYRVTQISNGTYAIGFVKLNVNPTPEATTPTDISMCDYNNDGIAIFDLTPLIAQILGVINPATATVTFHASLISAEAGVSTLVPINAFAGANGQTIYARLTNNATGCYDVTSFQLHVEPLPLAMSSYPDYALCDSNTPTGFATFDLNSRIDSILMGQTGVTVAFYNTQADALNGSNAVPNTFVNTSNPQTLWVRLTNQETGCFTVSTMNIRVVPLPQLVVPSSPYTVCDDNQDGTAVFDLTTLIPGLTQGTSGLTITFHETLTDAQVFGSTIVTPSSYINIQPFSQIIYARGADPISGCYTVMQIELEVNPAPIAPELSDIQVCDADSNPQSATTLINLTQQSPEILAQQPLPASSYIVTYYTSQSDAEAGTGTIIPATNYFGVDGESIWFRVELSATGCYAVGSFYLVINTPLALITPTPLKVCDNDANPNDQFTVFDLTIKDSEITQGSPSAVVTYYPSFALAQAGAAGTHIANPTTYVNTIPSVQTVGVRVTSSTGCVSVTTLEIRVTSWLSPIIYTSSNANSICVNYITGAVLRSLTLQTDIVNPSDYTFEWFEMANPSTVIGTDPTYIINTGVLNGMTRDYSVVVTSLLPGCDGVSLPYSVIQSGPAAVTSTPGYMIANLSGVQSITVGISGYGTYEYSLDDGPHQTSNIFNDVSLGTHQVHVWDMEGNCDQLIIDGVAIVESQIPAPTGLNSQSFAPGATLANITVNGTDVQWYASANNKNNLSILSTPLPLSTVLVDGTIYYATQTVGGIESTAYLPVTVHIVLGVDDNEILPIQFGPNPVKNSLTLQSAVVLKSITVYTMLGQKVFEQDYNDTDITIDLSKLAAGNYVLKAEGETGQKTIRIIKE